MTRGTKKYIVYYRVSTQKQGQSGLGLEAQKQAVETFLNGGRWEVIQELKEVESGKKDDRPQLEKALKLAKKHKATLLVAKLDRLSRNLAFLATLMESGVKIQCVDMPEANELTLQIMAVMAQHERKMISERTKVALAEAKKRGQKLGMNNPKIAESLKHTNKNRSKNANNFAESLKPTFSAYSKSGMSQREMVEALNSAKITTARGGQWSLVQVQRVLKRLEL